MIDNPTDIKILRAFIGTLAELDSLDESEQEQLSKIGQNLKENLDVSIQELNRFSLANQTRTSLYKDACENLVEDYQQQRRTKVINITVENLSDSDSNHKEVENISLSTDALGSLEILQTVLEANSIERAKQIKQKVIQANQLNDKPRWHWLGYLFGS